MSGGRAQALVELAVTLPVLVLLALGGAALARLADARAGLDAATGAALAEAVRAPDPSAAASAALARFRAVVALYPLQSPTLNLDVGDFARGGPASASASATVDIGFAPVPGLPRQVEVHSAHRALIEPWRSRVNPPTPTPTPEVYPSPCKPGCIPVV